MKQFNVLFDLRFNSGYRKLLNSFFLQFDIKKKI